jgi:hypothetical protein
MLINIVAVQSPRSCPSGLRLDELKGRWSETGRSRKIGSSGTLAVERGE